jgi:putative transposase
MRVESKEILRIIILKEGNMFVIWHFLSDIVDEYGQYPVSTYGGTWYPQAYHFLKLKPYIHSPYEKSTIERTMQYIKDRSGGFDDYIPYKKKKSKIKAC